MEKKCIESFPTPSRREAALRLSHCITSLTEDVPSNAVNTQHAALLSQNKCIRNKERDVVSPSASCPSSTEAQSWDSWEVTAEQGRSLRIRRDHACRVSSIISNKPFLSLLPRCSPSSKLLERKPHFGVQWGFSLWRLYLNGKGMFLQCHPVRAGEGTCQDKHAAHRAHPLSRPLLNIWGLCRSYQQYTFFFLIPRRR